MSDLTREEIRRACGAVGWKWHPGKECPPIEKVDMDDFDYARDQYGSVRFFPYWSHFFEGDAWALLESVGEEFELRFVPGDHPRSTCIRWVGDSAWTPGPNLPAAAIRAVNAWAESRERKAT